MWINPANEQVVNSEEDIRHLYPNWSAPLIITNDMLAQLDPPLLPVVPTTPVFDPTQQTAEEVAPALVDGEWTQQWALTDLPADIIEANTKKLVQSLSDDIDAKVAEIYLKPQQFLVEYQRREQQARAYITANRDRTDAIPVIVPDLIFNFARSSNMEPLEAAQTTVSQADKLYTALDQLANLRMRKYEIQRTTTAAEARAKHVEIMNSIRAVAATLT